MAELLRETAAAHHRMFAESDGHDPEWPRWYADHSAARLAQLLGRPVNEGELAARLAALDEAYRAEQPDVAWAQYYAARLAGGDP